MRSTVGLVPEIAIAQPLTRGETARFAGLLQATLGTRHDRDLNLAAYTAGVAAAPAGPLRLGVIAAASGGLANTKQLRHVIEHAPVDESLLRRRLVRAAPFADQLAFTIEQHVVEYGEERGGIDIYSVHAVGRDRTTPLGWAIEPIPPEETEAQPLGIDDVEERAVMRLLTQLGEDYDAVEPSASLSGTGPPPVILHAPSFGESQALRAGLRSTVGEYVARVSGSYTDLCLRSDPIERVEPDRQLQDYYAPIPPGADPPPRELLDGSPSRCGREYALPIVTEGQVEYAIVRPLPMVPPGALLGTLPEQRARELANLAREIRDTHAAQRLRAADLRHSRPDALRRHALLVSMLAMFRSGRLLGATP
ncbi:MAG: hypothetical protein ACYDA6_00510 [Solirubrobacteraceae bacterium]